MNIDLDGDADEPLKLAFVFVVVAEVGVVPLTGVLEDDDGLAVFVLVLLTGLWAEWSIGAFVLNLASSGLNRWWSYVLYRGRF